MFDNLEKIGHLCTRHPGINVVEMTDSLADSSDPQKSCWTNNGPLKTLVTLWELVLCFLPITSSTDFDRQKTKPSKMKLAHFIIFFPLVYGKNSNVDFKTLALLQSPINVWVVASFSCGALRSRRGPPAEQAALTVFSPAKKSKQQTAAGHWSLHEPLCIKSWWLHASGQRKGILFVVLLFISA